ncbi:MAG: DUF86 domain-containing protein [bacterium]|nr:DUF86 domain-containing protein [bacterium]
MPRDAAILLDIAGACRRIQEFKQGMDQVAFLKDLKTQSAILHQLMILGEAVKRLSEAFRGQHVHIPWRLIAGMRDKLIHDYGEVDLEEVWRAVEGDIPDLLVKVEPLLPSEPDASSL